MHQVTHASSQSCIKSAPRVHTLRSTACQNCSFQHLHIEPPTSTTGRFREYGLEEYVCVCEKENVSTKGSCGNCTIEFLSQKGRNTLKGAFYFPWKELGNQQRDHEGEHSARGPLTISLQLNPNPPTHKSIVGDRERFFLNGWQ